MSFCAKSQNLLIYSPCDFAQGDSQKFLYPPLEQSPPVEGWTRSGRGGLLRQRQQRLPRQKTSFSDTPSQKGNNCFAIFHAFVVLLSVFLLNYTINLYNVFVTDQKNELYNRKIKNFLFYRFSCRTYLLFIFVLISALYNESLRCRTFHSLFNNRRFSFLIFNLSDQKNSHLLILYAATLKNQAF